jgi:hypothetical protein
MKTMTEIIMRESLEIPVNVLPEMLMLIQKFLYESYDDVMQVENVTKQIHRISSSGHGTMFLIYADDKLSGFFTMEQTATEYDSLITVVNYLYLDESLRRKKVFDDIEQIISSWSTQRGSKEVAFYTRRNADAFKRLLWRRDWKTDSVVLKRCV